MSRGREMALSLVLVGIGAAITLVAAGRPRVAASGTVVSGADTPAARALAVVALAGIGALLLARGWIRTLIGVLLVAVSVALVMLFLSSPGDVGTFSYTEAAPRLGRSGWAWFGVGGALVLAVGAASVALRARRWPAPRDRYDTSARPQGRPRDPWEALDRGEDPTAGPLAE
jgi:tryptophan-associated transmembrane protein